MHIVAHNEESMNTMGKLKKEVYFVKGNVIFFHQVAFC
jgi:hypothetical protein